MKYLKSFKIFENFNNSKGNILNENVQDYTIWFDMDGVLANFEKGIKNDENVSELYQTYQDIIKSDDLYKDYIGLSNDEVKLKLKDDLPPNSPVEHPFRALKRSFIKYNKAVYSAAKKQGFFANLELMPGARKMVEEAYELLGKKPNILSAPVEGKYCEIEKRNWVKKHFGDLIDEIIITTDKGSAAKSKFDILIDDRKKYIDKFEKGGGTGILYLDAKQSINDLKNIIR